MEGSEGARVIGMRAAPARSFAIALSTSERLMKQLLLVLVTALLLASACSQPTPQPSESAAESTTKPSEIARGQSPAVIDEFVQEFNAGDIETLAQTWGERVDWRVFTRSEQLVPLRVVPPEETDSFVAGYIEGIDRERFKEMCQAGWQQAKAGAATHGIQLVVVHSKGLEAYTGRRLYVPALVFGVAGKPGGHDIVFGTVFAELMEELSQSDGSMDRIVEEGIDADPEKLGGLESPSVAE